LAGERATLPDHVGKADSMKGGASEVQTGDFADDGLDAGDASAMPDRVLRQRPRPAADESDLRFRHFAENLRETATRQSEDGFVGLSEQSRRGWTSKKSA
jgi:hypothetical protein